jgi:hypothetical protein
MVLRAGYLVVATKLQEASSGLMHSDVRDRLRDAVNDAHRGTGKWGSYIDHDGDGDSGDVIYSCDGDIRKAPYELGNVGGKQTANIDMDNSTNVVPRTTYEEEADDDDHYSAMEESFKSGGLYTGLPLYERFISKDERNKADEGSFAGKGKSFPILKPGDVSAAVHAMGRAGPSNYGMAQLKANIIRIAKKKGWTSSLPKSWRGDSTDTSEAVRARQFAAAQVGPINLVESAATLETIVLKEARSDYEIKLIAPGKGSSAFYPESVLRRDGPNVFKAGTHVYLNHPTAAEEASRPEGDVKNLAGVLSTGATYHESHAKGPGLYARMKVFADHAQTVEEKAPHVGMSIRASGVAEANRKQDGLPVLKELTHAESVDVVTRAGAGGMILTEAAKPGNSQEVEMTKEEITAICKEAVKEAVGALQAPVKSLEQRALKGDAMVEASRILNPLALRESAKTFVVDNVLRGDLPVKDGALDTAKFGELVTAEAKRVAAAIGYEGVQGMGSGPTILDDKPLSAKKQLKEAKRRAEVAKMEHEDGVSIFESLGMPKEAAEFAAKGRAA